MLDFFNKVFKYIMKTLRCFPKTSFTTKFSVVAFVVTTGIGFMSMGILGLLLYYCVFFIFPSYPNINEWHGDWVWPAMIGAGMFWSLGFIFGGLAWYSLKNKIASKAVLRLIYGFILWTWACIIFWLIIINNLEKTV